MGKIDGSVMLSWAKDLFPICRSLSGAGTLETLQYLQSLNSELKIIPFATGERVGDWEIPKEWNITDSYIEHESGKKFAELSVNNLHVLGYSVPVDIKLEREALVEHIYTLPDQPDDIPYVTSYYREQWGFCMSHSDMLTLPEGKYRAVVNSTLEPGLINIGHARLTGTSNKEIFFSSYVCHPSMANNELSGPVLLSALMQYVRDKYPSPHFNFRFSLVVETIGSIAYLDRFLPEMKMNVHCGFNLSCVGDDRAYSHVESPSGDNLADRALEAALIGKDNVKTYSFLDRGSDERQYCAPHVELPLCTFCRSKFSEYPEYHTSADNFDVVTESGLNGALEVMTSIIDAFELGEFPSLQTIGEPQLGKRGLYPNVSIKNNRGADILIRKNIIAYSNGKISVFEIAKKIGVPLQTVISEIAVMKKHGLIKCEHSQSDL